MSVPPLPLATGDFVASLLQHPPPDDPEHRRQQQRQRIAQYQQAALEHPDPLCAVLGAENAAVMSLAQQYREVIRQALDDAPALETIAEVSPATDQYLRLLRQMDRFTHFEERLRRNLESPTPLPKG